MTRSDLAKSLASLSDDLSLDKIEELTKYIFSLMSDNLVGGDRIEVRGFGTFSIRHRNARIARNPKTGETFQVEAKLAIHFKAGKELKDRLNRNI